MRETIAKMNAQAAARQQENLKPIHMHCLIEQGALEELPSYLIGQGWRKVLIAADAHTLRAAGQRLMDLLQHAGLEPELCIISPNAAGDVIADEASVVELLLQTGPEIQALIAVGAGTLHDITRFVCNKTGKPFVSVPTAASVDGFTSAGSPLILRQIKTTIQASPPEAIFADLDILAQAPRRLTAAGFGDMLGKFTSLAYWKFSAQTAGEPFSPFAYEITRDALQACLDPVDAIGKGSIDGIRVLMEALILSGLSMLMVGHSRPASGGEHHLSHFWEMAFIREGRRQQLHGAKVGVATLVIASLYREMAEADPTGPALVFREIPDPAELKILLERAGAPSDLESIGISRTLAEKAVNHAHTVRDRYTGLKYRNENRIAVPFILP